MKSEQLRWLDPASDADGSLRDLLASAAQDEPSPEVLAALTARLGPQLDVPAAPPAASAGAPTWLRFVLGGVGVGAVAGLVGWFAQPPQTPSRLASGVTRVTWRMPSMDNLPANAPLPAQTQNDAPRPAPKVAPGPVAERESELSLVKRAHAALRAGQANQALSVVHRLEREYPRGVLAQEREVIAIEALAASGNAGAARTRAHGFLRYFPRSSHARRVRAIVGLPEAVETENDNPKGRAP